MSVSSNDQSYRSEGDGPQVRTPSAAVLRLIGHRVVSV